MSNMVMNVEFLAGTDILTACLEARTKARQLDLAYVVFKFNGVQIHIHQRTNVEDIAEKYMNQDFKGKNNNKFLI